MGFSEDDLRDNEIPRSSNEAHDASDVKKSHKVDAPFSLNPLANEFNPKLSLNSIKKLLFKELNNITCKINELSDLNYFEPFEENFKVSADDIQTNNNNMQTNYDYKHSSVDLNSSAITFEPKPKKSKSSKEWNVNPLASSCRPDGTTLSPNLHKTFTNYDNCNYFNGNHEIDQEKICINDVIDKQDNFYCDDLDKPKETEFYEFKVISKKSIRN